MDQEILLAPLDVSPAYQAVVDRLSASVALGVLLPGDRLPSERALADRLGVSRVTVREGLRVLQGAGVISTRGGSSGWVVTNDVGSDGRPLIASDRSGANLEQVFEFRRTVEGAAARLAAQRRTSADVQHLKEHVEALRVSQNVGDFRRADSAFHLAIAAAAGNPLILRAVVEARTAAFTVVDARPYEVRKAPSISDHQRSVAAIARGDAIAAEKTMTEHLERARDEIVAVLADRPGQAEAGWS